MNTLLSKKCHTEYFNISNEDSYIALGNCILNYLENINLDKYTPVILCIGTDRATGDCLGPLVGEQLYGYHDRFQVIGNLSEPVHALNLKKVINQINSEIDRPFVIAIDASLGVVDHVGFITVSDCPIAPGKGVNKKLPAIGDISITGIVNVSGQSPGLLQSTRLYTVMQLANCIADALKYSISYLEGF